MVLCWVDVLTPKQAMFLWKLAPKLEHAGFKVLITSRRYRELNGVMKLRKINSIIIGKHGGKTLQGKLKASISRTMGLAKLIMKLKPEVAISFASVEAARITFGLRIPHVCLCDSPHSTAVAKLTIPLIQKLLTPWIIPKRRWTQYGIMEKNIIHYRALDPYVWLKDYQPDRKIVEELKLDLSKPIIVVRASESWASYLIGKVNELGLPKDLVNFILECSFDVQFIVLARYWNQIQALRRVLKRRAIIPNRVVDSTSLLYYSSVFIGGGGTMNTEAALIGIPTISCYPREPYTIEKFLISKGLVHKIEKPEETLNLLKEILENLDYWRKKHKNEAMKLMKKMEDPIPKVISVVKEVCEI